MQKITPHLWFNNQAEEAVNFYTTIFPQSKILSVTRYNEASAKVSGLESGTVMTLSFKIHGQNFLALNGGPIFQFTPAISFLVKCQTQEEIDYYWNKLTAGGDEQPCGWLTDKFGISWQIVPAILEKIIASKNATKNQKTMTALFQMRKIIIADLLNANKK